MIVYFDTSALVKLYVEETFSPEVRDLLDEASMVSTCVIAYVEARSAFARRCREGSLTAQEHGDMKANLDRDWPHLLALGVSAELVRHAGVLVEEFSLRAFDGLHLAAYLSLREQSHEDSVVFSCFDSNLAAAAAAASDSR